MTRLGPRRPPSSPAGLAAALPLGVCLAVSIAVCLAPATATAQAMDCSALRAAIDDAGPAADPAEADAALRRQRDEILRTRDTANRTGCGDGFFDDPDSIPCRSLARRIGMLQVGLQRLKDQVARGDPAGGADDRRRDLQARFDAQCTADHTADRGGDRPGDRADAGEPSVTAVPVDPDAPPGPAAKPRAAEVLCVRHCDGAFYPLAADVAADRMADMDRICQAQCPSAESSAYARTDGGGSGDVSGATATDGSAYSALPAAFGYLKGATKACSCRAPHQSWAEALAGAEALLQPHKGDVTVTAELAEAMARPAPTTPATAQKPVPAASRPAKPPKATRPARPDRGSQPDARVAVPPLTVPAPPSGLDLTRAFRGSDPTL